MIAMTHQPSEKASLCFYVNKMMLFNDMGLNYSKASRKENPALWKSRKWEEPNRCLGVGRSAVGLEMDLPLCNK